jgi:hypothetical protein
MTFCDKLAYGEMMQQIGSGLAAIKPVLRIQRSHVKLEEF